ncbi:MAG TPA: cofactor-independent phosphoglycerate mutase [Oscillospiraceae bacterium]|nr:cofactor-independent phosphoglycerate mutase [Oscillospiraceae bacterium]
MKYAVVLCDGMADYPVEALGGKTPMEVAKKPNIDALASKGEVGLVRTVAAGLKPGSDVANMSVLGFDPKKCYTGRSPLEAVSIGVKMSETDIALRCNLVTLSDEADYGAKTMLDYSGGDISTEEAAQIIETVQEHFDSSEFDFYSGVAYRHCLIVHNGTTNLGKMTPPHDISGRVIGEYLSTSPNAEKLIAMMRESYDLLKDHPVNKKRIAEGKLPANSIWLWGEGSRPALPSFEEKFGVKGSIVSAVDLLKGIGICAGMNTPEVEGATGYIDTNFEGKANAAIDEWRKGQDLVYIHVEAPDECGHRNEPENKVKAIELIDSRIMPIILDYLNTQDDYKVMVLPDHPTPISTRTHASDPVPYLIYRKGKELDSGVASINEKSASETGNFVDPGFDLMGHFLKD